MAGANSSTKTRRENVIFMIGGLLRLCLINAWYSAVSEEGWNDMVGWFGVAAVLLHTVTVSFSPCYGTPLSTVRFSAVQSRTGSS